MIKYDSEHNGVLGDLGRHKLVKLDVPPPKKRKKRRRKRGAKGIGSALHRLAKKGWL